MGGLSAPFSGCGPVWNLAWLRGAGTPEARERAVSFQTTSIRTGIVDFYLRWWNGAHAIFNGFGKTASRCSKVLDGGLTEADLVNMTSPAVVRLKGGCFSGHDELRVGLLPDTFFAQYGFYGEPWPAGASAMVSRATKPAQRDRLRLDRYDAQDFDEMVAAMKAQQLWFL